MGVLCLFLVIFFKVFGLKGDVDWEIVLDFLGVEYEFYDNFFWEKVFFIVEVVEEWLE